MSSRPLLWLLVALLAIEELIGIHSRSASTVSQWWIWHEGGRRAYDDCRRPRTGCISIGRRAEARRPDSCSRALRSEPDAANGAAGI